MFHWQSATEIVCLCVSGVDVEFWTTELQKGAIVRSADRMLVVVVSVALLEGADLVAGGLNLLVHGG